MTLRKSEVVSVAGHAELVLYDSGSTINLVTTDLVTRHGIRGKRIRGTVSSGLDDRQLQLVAEHEIPLMASQSDYPVLIKCFEVDDLNCILEDVDPMVKYAAFPECYGRLAKQAGKVSIIIGAGEWQLHPHGLEEERYNGNVKVTARQKKSPGVRTGE